MGYGNQPKIRTLKVVITVMVDDVNKYEAEMERFCAALIGEIRAAHRNLTGGNPSETITITPTPND